MSDNRGWPGKPGVPLNSDRDGWHVIQRDDAEPPIFVQYFAPKATGWPETARWLMEYPNLIDRYKYHGPAITPAEGDALVSQSKRDALEKAAREARIMASVLSSPSAQNALRFFADTISARLDTPSGMVVMSRDAEV